MRYTANKGGTTYLMDSARFREIAYRLTREDPDCWSHFFMYAFGELDSLFRADHERLYAFGLVDRAGRIPPPILALLDDAPTP